MSHIKMSPGLDLLERVRLSRSPHVIVIPNTMANAIEAMKRGAYEYLTKPLIDLFEELVLRAAGEREQAASLARWRMALSTLRTRALFGGAGDAEVFKAIGRAARAPRCSSAERAGPARSSSPATPPVERRPWAPSSQ